MKRRPKQSRNDPAHLLVAARALRGRMEDDIPKTWEQYYAKLCALHEPRRPRWTIDYATAYWFTRLVQEQGERDCTFDQAADAVMAVCPELYADYWAALPPIQGA